MSKAIRAATLGLIAALLAAAQLFVTSDSNAQVPHHRLGAPELTVLVSSDQASIQQQLIQTIRLESLHAFDALDVDLGTPKSAEVIELMAPTLRPFESWGVRGYVYETRRAIFPTISGLMTIPAVRVNGRTLSEQGESVAFEVRAEPVDIDVRPAAAELAGEPWLVADAVQISEAWSLEPEALQSGQLAVRTITVRATGTTAERLPSLNMPISRGVRVAAREPTRRTEITENGLVGHLQQKFDVHVATSATTDISGIRLAWWNGLNQTAERSAIRAYRIEPLPADLDVLVKALAQQARDEQRAIYQRAALAFLLALLVVIALLIALRPSSERGAKARHVAERVLRIMIGRRVELPDSGYRQAIER